MSDHIAVDLSGQSTKPVHLKSVTTAAVATSRTRKGLKKKNFKNHKQMKLDFQDPQCLVPLSSLAAEGKLEELKSSIDTYNLTLKETDQNGCTFLHHAAAHNQITVMQYLIERGIALNVTDSNGNTALHLACNEECVEACHLLLTSGASDTILNKELNSPLHIAAQGRNKSLSAILEHPIHYLVLGYRRRIPLHVMAEVDNIDGVKLLHEKIVSLDDKNEYFRLRARDEDGLTPMHLAARNNSHHVLEFFLQSCTNYGYGVKTVLEFLDEENSTPLHAAIDSGHFEVAEVLLRHGASPTASKGDLIPPLHLACSQGRSRILKAIVKYAGHEILNHTDQHQRTPLHYCVLSIHSSFLIPLIMEHAKITLNIDAQDNKGRTSLHNATTCGNLLGTKDLLSYGANPLIKDRHGFNALHVAVIRNRKVIVDVLLEYPQAAELSTSKSKTGCFPLHLALRLGHGELIPGLLSAVQFEVENSKDDNGNNYLHLAAKKGNYKALKSLLDDPVIQKGLNEPNKLGATPLHSAAFGDHYRCLELLLNNGAMFHKCFSGETAFHIACRKGYTYCAKLLINVHPSQLDLCDKNGNSALHAAAQSKVPSVVALLLDKGCKLNFNLDSKTFFNIVIDGADVNCAMAVIQHDRWQECLDFHSPSRQSPMIDLIQKMPNVAQVVLNRCHSKADTVEKTHRDYWERFDFKYLLTYERMIEQNLAMTNQHSDTQGHPKIQRHDSTFLPSFDDLELTTVHDKRSSHRQSVTSIEKGEKRSSNYPLKSMESLENMVAYKRANLLTHPLVDAFLTSKWRAYGRFIHSTTFLLHFLLVLLLSVFVVIIPSPIQVLGIRLVNQTDLNDTNYADPNSLKISSGAQVVRGFVILLNSLFVIVIIFFSVMAFLRSKLIKFVRTITTWVNVSTVLFNFVFLVAPNTLEVWPVGAVACFFSWLSLLFGLQYFTVAGTIVKMIVAVSKSVILVLLICISMLLAFAFSFYILAGSLSEFSNVGYSFLSVFGFMLGELPYEMYVKEDVSGNLIYGKFFLIFMIVLAILMSIVIANLLIGLAIGDIERIKVSAIVDKKGAEIEYLAQIDQVLPNRLLYHLFHTTDIRYPNATYRKSIFHRLRHDSIDWFKDILYTGTETIHSPSSTTVTTADNTKEISELKMHILDLKETIQQLQDSMLLHRKRDALADQQSGICLNSLDLMEDFPDIVDPSATDL